MKYVAPEMEIITLSVDTAVANDYDVEEDFAGMISNK